METHRGIGNVRACAGDSHIRVGERASRRCVPFARRRLDSAALDHYLRAIAVAFGCGAKVLTCLSLGMLNGCGGEEREFPPRFVSFDLGTLSPVRLDLGALNGAKVLTWRSIWARSAGPEC